MSYAKHPDLLGEMIVDRVSLPMKRKIRRLIQLICLSTLLLFSLSGSRAVSIVAQSDTVIWLRPSNLSNTPQNSEYPAIVADGLGYVHVFWSEDVDGAPFQSDEPPQSGNTILYKRWDGVSWTSPVDVLYVPGEDIAVFVAADVDADNRLHVVWTGQWNIYYSSAPSWQATSAHAWSKPVVVTTESARTRWESDVVADTSGNLHIVYATRGSDAGVYHIRSQDGGLTWSLAVRLSQPFDRLETSFSHVRVITDDAGRFHVVWQANQEDGYGQAVYYVRSTDEGETWSRVEQLGYRDPGDFEASYPCLADVSDSELHLIYLDGTDQGRLHRISRDGGETWSAPCRIIPEMEGVNGYVFPLVDCAGQMHLIANMRTRVGQIGGIFYAHWLGREWTLPVRIELLDQGGGAHFAAGAVRLGNELHVVWSQLDRGEIGHIHGVIPSISQISPLSIPSPQPSAPTPSPPAATDVALPMASPPPRPVRSSEMRDATAPASPFMVNPMVIGMGASMLLIVGVMLWTRVRPR
jgi:hypothetical protein